MLQNQTLFELEHAMQIEHLSRAAVKRAAPARLVVVVDGGLQRARSLWLVRTNNGERLGLPLCR